MKELITAHLKELGMLPLPSKVIDALVADADSEMKAIVKKRYTHKMVTAMVGKVFAAESSAG